ncbi:two-component sensor histidine kinase [Dactylosporangium aurantiacum]|uniref:histidine kinase n=1 Tax=Dactylosporangium aurantiacum TaxID=35754 RepID=A0A9Q9MBH4_9ACTN|nr:histidine kinase [Dactylosporangium aurantiacum]MDG6102830.1 histidine kinase [Dactylosporangium aurantiacum]UWZ52928.1 two-component sensor histidine kinase [Dactylosporangium aurantiacum]
MSRTDLALAGAFVAFALTEEVVAHQPGGWWPFVLAAFAPLVALRRAAPLAILLANCVAGLKYWYPHQVVPYRLWQLAAMIIAAYTVGRHVPLLGTSGWRARARGVTGLALAVATGTVFWQVDPVDPMGAFFFPVAPWVLGAAFAVQHRQSSDAAAARAAIREQRVREAVMEERVRIARELHDMVAHSVTVMVIQAGVVRRRLDAGLTVDADLLRSIESSGRDAVGELRRTLGLLRGDTGGTTAAPVGLDRLDDLLAQVGEAGLTVTLRREGTPVPLAPAADLSAYRIVQEALTNVLKHAGPAHVTVGLRYAADGVHLSVVDSGPSAGAAATRVAGLVPAAAFTSDRGNVPADRGAGGGQGLIGMRERATLFGGDFDAGPRPGGGFAVHARLPLLVAP